MTVYTRPIEKLVGQNAGIVRQIVDRDVHVGRSYLSAVRHVCSKLGNTPLRSIPVPLRRGLILAVIEEHRANREVFDYVMRGR